MVIPGTPQQKLPMRTSIATVSISGEFPEKLSAIAKAGFCLLYTSDAADE